MAKLTTKKLLETVDRLGRARDKLHTLKFEERALTEIVRTALRMQRRKAPQLVGAKYCADLVISHGLEIVDVAALKRAAGRKFMKVIRADLAAVRRELGNETAERIGQPTRTAKVRVVSNEPATAPRRAPPK